MGRELLVIGIWFAYLTAQERALEVLIKRGLVSPFAARKISHLTVGLWVWPLSVFVSRWYLAAIPIAMILAANVRANAKRGNLGRLQQRLFPLVGFLLPLTLILYFWQQQRSHIVVLAVLGMTVGDTVAALVGIRFGKRKISWTGKTVEGAIANFVSTFLVIAGFGLLLYELPVTRVALPAAAAAFLEAALPGAWDNPATIVVLLVLIGYPL